MKTFVVAWINFFDNELNQEVVKAENEIEALLKSSQNLIDEEAMEDNPDLQTLKIRAFDTDGMISVIQI